MDQIWSGTGRDWIIDYALRDLVWDFSFTGSSADRKN
jgi:hypothetical protein